ncbi:MAG: ChaN family lipoprotein [Akkermansiaceae bacterium]|nr:ChaN family lipoprotein [Armatimonadota bacterium]
MTRRDFSLLALVSVASPVGPAIAAAPDSGWEIREGRTGKKVRWRDLPGRLASANAIFLGEEHDDPETHRVEAALLEAAHKKIGARLTLAMEMMERDGQTVLNDYLAGKIDEAAFAKASRLWQNYATDYRPMVEYAKANGIPVLASNAPRKIVSKVGKEGLSSTLASLSAEEKTQIAASVTAPEGDTYAVRFAGVIAEGHGDGPVMPAPTVRRFYEAQCVRDDTMAETVAGAIRDGRTVVHVNGSFHSDAGLGTAARVLWRCPLEARIAVVRIVPYKNRIEWEPFRNEADYLVFVPDRRKE